MSKPLRSLRLSPKSDYARFTGNRGEIFYDPANNTLRVFDSQIQGGVSLARADLINITNAAFAAKATAAGVSGDYGYLCSNHGGMNGTITIKAISAI